MRIANENEAMYGKEPSVDNLLDATSSDWSSALSEALNWYNFSPSKEEKKKWFLDYLQEVGGDVQIASLVPEFNFISAGTIARLWSRGVKNDNFQKKLEDYTSKILKEGKSLSKFSAETAAKKSALKSALLSREVSEAINHIDTVLDGFIETGKTTFDAASWIRSNKVSKEAQEAVQNRFQKLLDEVLASDTDPDLKEGYSNFTKKQKTLLIGLLTDIVNTKIAKVPGARKPRKKKAVSPEKMVKRLKYMKSFKELKLESIDPTIIVGANSLWVYNTKYRILTNYVSDSGLAVKGSTLLNINEQETKSKKLRKPEVTVPEVMTAGKVPLRKVFDNLTTGFLNANGRINKDTILLRVVK